MEGYVYSNFINESSKFNTDRGISIEQPCIATNYLRWLRFKEGIENPDFEEYTDLVRDSYPSYELEQLYVADWEDENMKRLDHGKEIIKFDAE